MLEYPSIIDRVTGKSKQQTLIKIKKKTTNAQKKTFKKFPWLKYTFFVGAG